MYVAVLGATSQIARDLIVSFSKKKDYKLHLFARRPADVLKWLDNIGLTQHFLVNGFDAFGVQEFDAVLNFVGVGDPAKAAAMGAKIFDVTLEYDELVLEYLDNYPGCRYIFMSSGAAYGSNFDTPVGDDTSAIIPINALKPQDWYGIAKLYAECRHRSSENFSIVDVRIFNYFSYSQDIYARFFIADIVRSILDNKVLRVSADNMVRDYVGRADFFSLIEAILTSPATNIAIDCYSQAPIDKFSLLDAMKDNFGLRYEIDDDNSAINATGAKPYYYSVNKGASYFGYEPSYTSLLNIQNEVKIISLDIS